MKFWTEVRRRVLTGKLSKRAACREYDLSWHTLKKILAHQEPPGYRRKQPRRKPTLAGSTIRQTLFPSALLLTAEIGHHSCCPSGG
ncbi:MAG: hypothetical protein MK179_09880 [Pirellulaceae bacterium]|nr:hypothetical protein [Pirellulaceae bacterium]